MSALGEKADRKDNYQIKRWQGSQANFSLKL